MLHLSRKGDGSIWTYLIPFILLLVAVAIGIYIAVKSGNIGAGELGGLL